MQEERLREDAGLSLRDLGERASQLWRMGEFADGRLALSSNDRRALATLLTRHAAEATETADYDEQGALPRLVAGDPDRIYVGCSREVSIEMVKDFAKRERHEAATCEAILVALRGEGGGA